MTTEIITPITANNNNKLPTTAGIKPFSRPPKQHVELVGNYVIHRKTLGSGSMGTVKLAECLSDKDNQQYAVKIMPKINLDLIISTTTTTTTQQDTPTPAGEKSKDPKDTPIEREQRTIREMAIMHLLRHPNICQLREWVVSGDNYYMFLEYIQGGQLLDYIISNGKLREKLARKFARQIASALDYCHRNSIVHRDLKIENILITNNEEIKIIDFGLSNIYSPSRLLNTFCGSLYFAAPELLQARNYTGPEVDVWSFGIVLYVLVCGRVPFDDTSLPALHQKIKAGIVDYPEHLSRDVIDLLSRVLVVDPKKRETLSFVIHHPWMNKGYDEPIFNHLPHRQPLKSIDPQVVFGMQGFGLGSPEEIKTRLERIVSSDEYQAAAFQIDQNYQLQRPQHQNNNNNGDANAVSSGSSNTSSNTSSNSTAGTNYSFLGSRFRRTLSLKRSNYQYGTTSTACKQDDPQSLPAMYDPFVSIYYLVKERREFDEKVRLLASHGYQSPVQLGRSASTSLSKSSSYYNNNNNVTNNNSNSNPYNGSVGLHRRKTERVPPSHTRNMFRDENKQDWAAPVSSINGNHKSSSASSNTFQKSTTNLLRRSKSAAKRLLSNNAPPPPPPDFATAEELLGNSATAAAHLSSSPLQAATEEVIYTNNAPSLGYSSSIKKKLVMLRSNSVKNRQQQQQKKNGSNEEVSCGSSLASGSGGRFIEEGVYQQQTATIPKISTHPKSLFNWNRRHLFKCPPLEMVKYVQSTFLKLGIRYSLPSVHDPFMLQCELFDWVKYQEAVVQQSHHEDEGLAYNQQQQSYNINNNNEPLLFTLMIYQARWAGGRLGIKVMEAEVDVSKIYTNIYHTLLNELQQLSF